MNDYIAALLFFAPAGMANMTPVFVNKLPVVRDWNTPLDFGVKWHGKRLLGDNKRLRGLVFGALAGGITAVIISKLNANTVVTIAPFWMGSLLGCGALLGDAVESFFKRLRDLKPGESLFPFDQLDYIAGGLLAAYLVVHIPLWAVLTITVVYFGLHILISYLAFLFGLKDKAI